MDHKKIENKKVQVIFIILRSIVFLCLFFLILFGPFILMGHTEQVYFFSSDSYEMVEVVNFLFYDEALSSFTYNEASHMQDVKSLLELGKWLFLASLVVVFLYFYNFKDETLLKKVGIVGVGFQLVLILLILISFNFVFTWFHKIFFPMGNWSFPMNSLLIQIFPLEFFYLAAVIGSLISFFVFLFCYYKGRS